MQPHISVEAGLFTAASHVPLAGVATPNTYTPASFDGAAEVGVVVEQDGITFELVGDFAYGKGDDYDEIVIAVTEVRESGNNHSTPAEVIYLTVGLEHIAAVYTMTTGAGNNLID